MLSVSQAAYAAFIFYTGSLLTAFIQNIFPLNNDDGRARVILLVNRARLKLF